MPPIYRRKCPRLWRHSAFRPLNDKTRLLVHYLLDGPQTNRIGFYYLSPAMAAEDLAWDEGSVSEALNKVCSAFGWQFDDKSRMLLIPSWWQFNQPTNPNVLIGNLGDLEELPESRLTQTFLDSLETFAKGWGEGFANVSETFRERYPKPFDSGTGTVTRIRIASQGVNSDE